MIRSTRHAVWILSLGLPLSVQIASAAVDSPLRVESRAAAPEETERHSTATQDVFDRMTAEQRHLFDRLSELASAGSPIPTLCWMEGTDPRIVEAFHAITSKGREHRFQQTSRWSFTATDGGGLGQGDPTNLTWSIVPDGTSTPSGVSNLVAAFDAQVPDWLSVLQAALDRWSELSGLNYIYEPNDDGVDLWSAPGVVGVRGDVRIAGAFIDGPSGVLGYNDFPNNGDMVLDTGDMTFFGNASDDHLGLRNTVAHEAGHGLGLLHVQSGSDAFLMEPFIQLTFDGPQLDDILGAQRHYGDRDEFPIENDDPLASTDLGLPAADGVLSRSGQSIDDDSDVDVHSFEVTTERPSVSSITVLPTGRVYMQGPQGGPESSYDSRSTLDLQFQLLDTDGMGVLGSASSTGPGEAEVLEPGPFPSVPGTYYVHTFTGVGKHDPDVRPRNRL